MNLPKYAVKFPVTVAMIMLAIGILGIISFNRLGTDLLPSIYNPRVVVELQSAERSPQDMEQRFARELEGQLGTVSNVVEVQSVCSVGRILVTATFSWGTDMDFALLDVQKKISSYESDPDVSSVTVAQYDPQEEPIMIYYLGVAPGASRDLDEIRRIAENVVKRNLERQEGVARTRVYGGLKREVRVEINEYLLQAYQLSTADIESRIAQSNADASGGRLVQQDQAYLIKGIGKFKDIAEVRNTVVGYKQGSNRASADSSGGQQQAGTIYEPGKVPIFLSDVAQVTYAPEERTDVVLLNGQEGVGLYIFKESKDNTVRVAEQVKEEIDRMRGELVELKFDLVYSQATFIDQAIGELKTTALFGILLAVLVLYAFLRNVGATFIVSLAIPISIMATFSLMFFQNLTLNIMTLGGLALGAGMLVDNAIVVIENIFRRRQLGESSEEAAVTGATEVGVAIVASTLTTIIVFLPIVYVRGVAAELFREQAWVVAFSLLSSLLVAFLLIPTLAARLFKRKLPTFQRQTLRFPAYERTLGWALEHGGLVIFLAMILLVGAVLLLPTVGSEFVPRSGENQLLIDLDLPPGSPLGQTTAFIGGVEERVRQLLGKRVEQVYSTVNVQSSQNLFFSGTQSSEHRAEMTLKLARGESSLTPNGAIDLLRPHFNFDGVNTVFSIRESSFQQTIGSGKAPVVIEISGNDLGTLQEIGQRLAALLRGLAGLNTIETSLQEGLPELDVQIDRLLAAHFDLDTERIGKILKSRLTGSAVSSFYSEGNDRNIRVVYPKMTRTELANLPIESGNGSIVRLSDIAQLIQKDGPKEIQRKNQSRVAHVTAQLDDGVKLSKAVSGIGAVLRDFALPPGYRLRYAGEEASRQASFSQMRFALILSVVLVYMVLASLFESLRHPFTIMLTLPLAGVGVVFAFLLVGEPLSIMAYIGVIMLAGIAANDSIVLVDYITRLRAAGIARTEAVRQAGRDRLRPILITSATTILALLPLTIGFGEGARLRAPMAIAVIGGLVTSTLLTLIVIPVVYEWIDRIHLPRVFQRAKDYS